MIAIEMHTQIQEDDSLGPRSLRQDLFAILEGAKKWSLWCMEAGETNVKGHVFTSLMLAHTQGLAEGLSTEEIARSLVESVGAAEDSGMMVFEKMLERELSEQEKTGIPDFSLDSFSDMLPGWESIVSTVSLEHGLVILTLYKQMPNDMTVDGYGSDPMNWSFEQANIDNAWLF